MAKPQRKNASNPAASDSGTQPEQQPIVADGSDNTESTVVELPEDLTTLDAGQLTELEQLAVAEFDGLYQGDTEPDVDGLARASELAETIQALRSENSRREAEAAAAVQEQQERVAQMAALRDTVHGGGDHNTTAVDGDGGEPPIEGEIVDPEPTLVADGHQPRATTTDRSLAQRGKRTLNGGLRKMAADPAARQTRSGPAFDTSTKNPTIDLAQAAQHAPDPRVPAAAEAGGKALVAAADLSKYRVGQELGTAGDIARAMNDRVRNVALTRGSAQRHMVAYMDREHRYTIGDKFDGQQMNEVLKAATNPEVLTASGGWCAPPTTRYDFFNIVCTDGVLDLPRIGVPRGSIQWPVSPSFNDIMGLDDNPWTWTNQDDIDAGGTNGAEKPCQQIPCPDMDDAELDCDGICLTVGNLVDFAWPELVENQVRLLMAAHEHYMNTRRIQAIAAGSVQVSPTSLGAGMIAPLLSALDLQAWDMRERFRMCADDILEVVLPRWVVGMVAADVALRQGLSLDDAFEVSLTRLANWLDARNLATQFVSDWQIGAAGQLGGPAPATHWPTQVQALMYPAGTWVLGEGLRLSLGVIRDSELNKTNDHTAAWMEECYLVARLGHQSRLISVDVCPNGNTNAGSQIDCDFGS